VRLGLRVQVAAAAVDGRAHQLHLMNECKVKTF